jgi:hypothetical protein
MTIWPKIYLLAILPLAFVVLTCAVDPASSRYTFFECRKNSDSCLRNCGRFADDNNLYTLCTRNCVHSFKDCLDLADKETLDPGSPPPKRRPPVAKPGGGTKQQ